MSAVLKLSVFAVLFLSSVCLQGQWSENRSVLAYAIVNADNPSIELNWVNEDDATGYNVLRRDYGAAEWGAPIANLELDANSFLDDDVELNKEYEYFILKYTNLPEPFSLNGSNLRGSAYLLAGINIAPAHSRGTLLLLYESSLMDEMPEEMDLLQNDLAGDGWNVQARGIEKTWDHVQVKENIDEVAEGGLDAIYLFGDIAVPYSGHFCGDAIYTQPPDGHSAGSGDHCGAWAADVFYAIPSAEWTDNLETTIGTRTWGENIPDDGKYDQIELPAAAEYAVGRVDLADLPVFVESEIELLQRYVQKSHEYKFAMNEIVRAGTIENNLASLEEGFATGARRDFSAMFGPEQIVNADMLSSNSSENYLMAYAAGGGTFTSANGVGNSENFTNMSGGIFNFIFGSFFGDYDNENNFLRAALASPKNGLTNIWSGRPISVSHPLALGKTIGDCILKTQNNTGEYYSGFYSNLIHTALMGDPSLRLDMFSPPFDLNISAQADNQQVELNWSASPDSDVLGYHVYRSAEPYANYSLLNSEAQTETTFSDFTPNEGENYYLVRALRLEETGSGSYYNLSQGINGFIDGIEAISSGLGQGNPKLRISPNPSNGIFQLTFDQKVETTILLTDQWGREVYRERFVGEIKTIEAENLRPGLYFLSTAWGTKKIIVKGS